MIGIIWFYHFLLPSNGLRKQSKNNKNMELPTTVNYNKGRIPFSKDWVHLCNKRGFCVNSFSARRTVLYSQVSIASISGIIFGLLFHAKNLNDKMS